MDDLTAVIAFTSGAGAAVQDQGWASHERLRKGLLQELIGGGSHSGLAILLAAD
jgi:hypothetical protein